MLITLYMRPLYSGDLNKSSACLMCVFLSEVIAVASPDFNSKLPVFSLDVFLRAAFSTKEHWVHIVFFCGGSGVKIGSDFPESSTFPFK